MTNTWVFCTQLPSLNLSIDNMGAAESKLPEEKLEAWVHLTFLKRTAILNLYERFRLMHETEIDADPCGEEVPIHAIVNDGFPELKANPFGIRICQVFSTCQSKDQKGNPDKMTFEDFVDMASVFSERAPIQIKADWAFRIFDFNNDNVIDKEDVKEAVKMLCGGEEIMDEDDISAIVSHVIREADVRRIGAIGPQEFRNMMTKSSDFSTNFTLRM